MEQPYWYSFVVHQHGGHQALGPQNSVVIFNLLWLSKRLIVCTEETGIYIRTFPNTLTSKMAEYHEIRICFSDKQYQNTQMYLY